MRASAPPPPPGRITAPVREGRPTEPPLAKPLPATTIKSFTAPPIDPETGVEIQPSEARTVPGMQSPLKSRAPEPVVGGISGPATQAPRPGRSAAPRPATEPEGPGAGIEHNVAPPHGPPASGDLATTRASDVLSKLAVERSTGIVEFRAGSVWKKLTLIEGRPTVLQSNIGLEGIGEQLVRSRLIPRFELDKALRESPRGEDGLVERLLVTKVLTAEQIAPELGKNIQDGLVDLFGWRQGTFEFVPQSVQRPPVTASVDLLQLAQKDALRNRPSALPDPRKR